MPGSLNDEGNFPQRVFQKFEVSSCPHSKGAEGISKITSVTGSRSKEINKKQQKFEFSRERSPWSTSVLALVTRLTTRQHRRRWELKALPINVVEKKTKRTATSTASLGHIMGMPTRPGDSGASGRQQRQQQQQRPLWRIRPHGTSLL